MNTILRYIIKLFVLCLLINIKFYVLLISDNKSLFVSQIMDLVDELFVFIFTELNEKCKKLLEAVGKQYPFEPLKV